jgi:hypothetical protein
MSRPAVPKRKSAKSEARQVMEADIMPIIGPAMKDFSRGAKDLISQGKTAYGVVKSGAQKVKDFLSK